nr:MAG: hypothetical protein [Bacteriophage sp.]UWG95327.1 MAG: hypothetical protein [Bacteriophage sp.]
MIIAGYGKTLVGMPEGSPFSLADLVTLAYLIENREPGGWARFDYSVADGDLWDARCGGRATLRARLRLLSRHGIIETKTVGVKGENGVRTFYRVNMGALGPIEVSPLVYGIRVLQC